MRKLIGILWAVPVALALVGCGGDGDSVDAWLGNWTVAGTQSTTCGNQSGTSQLSGLVAISAGPMGGTIRTLGGDCTTVWEVHGSTATQNTGQLCTVTVGALNATISTTGGMMTMNGKTATGMATGQTSNGACSYRQQFTLTKM
jgi:hypothetical protein